MQKYLQANSCKITQEEAQLIFKLRCRTINVKRNMKGMYDNLDCTACGAEEETQEHGTVNEKLIIARIFKENYDVLENMKK